MLKYLKCSKCGWSTVMPASRYVPDQMQCGAVVQYLVADNPEAGNDGPIKSLGMKPIGCGGEVVEVTEEEAMSYE